jgi:hypothetical protein
MIRVQLNPPIRLRRVTWKRPPTHKETRDMLAATRWGPVCFAKGNEWLFVQSDPATPFLKPDAPEGYVEVRMP